MSEAGCLHVRTPVHWCIDAEMDDVARSVVETVTWHCASSLSALQTWHFQRVYNDVQHYLAGAQLLCEAYVRN